MKAQEQLGMRIKFLRKERGWSQEDLALEANVNKNYICDLENGRRNPSLDILERISNAFGISLSLLFKGIETIPGIQTIFDQQKYFRKRFLRKKCFFHFTDYL